MASRLPVISGRDAVDLNTLRILGGWESLDVILKYYVPLIQSEDALEVYRNPRRRPV